MTYPLHYAAKAGARFICGAAKAAARTTFSAAYFTAEPGPKCAECTTLLAKQLREVQQEHAPLRPYTAVSPEGGGGKRANTGKLRYTLLSSFALTGLAKVLEYGAEKYTERDEAGNVLTSGADNWRKGLSWKATVDSLMRHTLAFLAGEDIDPESGLPHVHHMQCNTMFLAHFFETKTGSDDR